MQSHILNNMVPVNNDSLYLYNKVLTNVQINSGIKIYR